LIRRCGSNLNCSFRYRNLSTNEEEIDLATERDRLQKELTETNDRSIGWKKLLNSAFSEKAPALLSSRKSVKNSQNIGYSHKP
jgi:hypothetical protein